MRLSPRVPRTGVTIIAGALLASGTLAGCGNGSTPAAATGSAASSPSSAPSASAVSSAPSGAAKASASASASSGGSGGSAQPAGGPVPSGFAASSVTFVSQDEGFVLGTAPCSAKPCTSILRTTDRGKTWRGLPAPKVQLGRLGAGKGTAVWGIRFASPSTGFVFGDGVWETTDGGEHWAKVPGAPTNLEHLEVSDGYVLGVTYSCSTYCSGSLMRRPVSGGTFQKVPGVTTPGGLAIGNNIAATVADRKLVVTRNGGATFTAHQTPCQTDDNAAADVAVTGPDSLALLCVGEPGAGSAPKTVYTSADLGAHWTKAGSPSPGGDGGLLAGSTSKLSVASASGATEMYYSPDGGKSWSTSYQASDGGMGWADLGFTTPSDGVVVRGAPQDDANSYHRPGQLLLTSDGGASWHAVNW